MEFISKNLRESNELLSSILDNINSAIFIVNKEVKVVNFNNGFKTLFYKEDDDILGKYCGNALGCSFAVKERVECGNASHCDKCNIRSSILGAFLENVPIYKQKMVREFVINNQVITKYLEFSAKHITWHGEVFTVVIVDDLTEHELKKMELYSNSEKLAAAKAELEIAYQKLQQEEFKMLKLEQQSSVTAMIVTANHEINQPLAVLKGNLGLLKLYTEKNPCEGNLIKYIKKSDKAVDDITAILKKYRDSAADFDFSDYTKDIKMVNFKNPQSDIW